VIDGVRHLQITTRPVPALNLPAHTLVSRLCSSPAHTSVALPDAIEGAELPVIECHISNVHKREEFRHHSYISPVARGIIVGFGVLGHTLAINGLNELAQEGSRA
jgi:3-dehydroquinate dehydratase